ncbi:HigA family addiction module antitoxin [Pelistega sp. MC2]|uniref:HigA family addiction module antitoxin n=1 Tax=Pelistega sp. MC2 TaxID=1720297 RepID=UPI0008D9B2E6|nr:HigA family addiction module antitoxin [Pelistega sp. MC2]
MFNPAHPGEVLQEYLEGITVTEAAQKLGISRVSLSRILHGKTAITAETALRLAKGLNTSPNYWLNMQAEYDLWKIRQHNPQLIDYVVELSKSV